MVSMSEKKKQPRRNEKHKRYMQLLNSPRWWREVRVAQLQAHPLCQMCEKEGSITAAVDVHHLRPVQSVPLDQMEAVCYDPNNLISLCVPCHIKIHKQMGSRHDLKAMPAPTDEKERAFIRKWAGEDKLREMDERTEFRKTRQLPHWLLTKEQMKERTAKQHDDWKERMMKKFGNNGLQGTDSPSTVDATTED